MDLYLEIILNLLKQKEHNTDEILLNLKKLVHNKCYEAIEKIKKVIEDDSLDDPECFMRIESIICILEDMGSDGGNRHDFG